MKLKRMRATRCWFGLAVAAGAAACDSTKPEDELTLSQSITILSELWMLTERSYDSVAPCPLGDSAIVTYTLDFRQRGDTTLITSIATVTPDGCKLSADGDTLSLEAAAGIVFGLEGWRIYLDEELVDNEYDMAIAGAVTWSRTGGASNRCEVDLTMEGGHVREEYGEIDGDLTGGLCGRDVSFHFSEIDWGPLPLLRDGF